MDVHTTASVFAGHDAYGRAVFHTTRSPLGELLYRLKYRGDPAAVEAIADTAAAYLQSWRPPVEALVPVPPSNVGRRRQPVLEVARAVCTRAGVPLCQVCIAKTRNTPQLKNVYDLKQRTQLLNGAFVVDRDQTRAVAFCFSMIFTGRAPRPAPSRAYSREKALPQRCTFSH